MARLYWYILATSTVKPEASLTSFIAALKRAGFEIVDYEEETRRVLHRVPLSKLDEAIGLWDRYTETTVLEYKASGRAPDVRLSLLRRVFDQADETPSAKLILAGCSVDAAYAVFAELRRGRFLAKLCRREALENLVTQLPASLCTWIYPEVDPRALIKPAVGCISEVYERLLRLTRDSPSV